MMNRDIRDQSSALGGQKPAVRSPQPSWVAIDHWRSAIGNRAPVPSSVALLVVLWLGAGLMCSRSQAQDYSVEWYSIDGGGGTSSGEAFSVTGTIGQPDAGAMSGGPFTVEGGFWSILSTIPTPGAPALFIIPMGTELRISWPQPAEGWVLEWTAWLVSPPLTNTFTTVSPPYSTSETDCYVTLHAQPGHRFYRLRRE